MLIARALSPQLKIPLLFLSFVIFYGFLSVRMGQDANWDLKNYHLYNAFQLLDGRLYLDLMAAGFQSFFNPLLDVPYYLLALDLAPNSPRVVAFVMGAYSAAMAIAAILITQRVLSTARQPLPSIAVVFAIYIGLSGSGSVSQLGLTFNDVPVGALVLYGLFLISRLVGETDQRPEWFELNAVCGGMFFGLAAALKLTAAIFAPPLVIALFLSGQGARRSILAIVFFSIGWSVAFAAIAGWWNGKLFVYTGDPFFPLMNRVFHSSWYPLVDFFDDRFKPKTWAQIIAYPFFWLRPRPMTVTEVVFADPRFAACYAGVILILLYYGSNLLARRRSSARFSLPPPQLFVVVFLMVAYVIWQSLFSIYRYAVVIEALCGIPILLAVAHPIYLVLGPSRLGRSLVNVVMAAGAVLLQYKTVYPDWGRVPYGTSVFSVIAPLLPSNSLVVISGSPDAYVAPFLRADRVAFLGVTHTTIEARNYQLWNETERRINEHKGPIFVLDRPDAAYMRPILNELELTVDDNACEPIWTNLDRDIRLCRASAHYEAR